MDRKNNAEEVNWDEFFEKASDEHYSDINNARHDAKAIFDSILFFKLRESGSDEIKMQGADFKNRKRDIRRRKLKKLRDALNDIDDDLYFDLNNAKEEIGINVDVRALPIADEDKKRLRRALSYKGLIDAIDQALSNIKGTLGRSDLTPYYAAGQILLQHYETTGARVTASVREDISDKSCRPSDIKVKKKDGTVSNVRYSPAIQFLTDEFRKLSGDNSIKHSLSKTVIEKWLKGRLPEINVTF